MKLMLFLILACAQSVVVWNNVTLTKDIVFAPCFGNSRAADAIVQSVFDEINSLNLFNLSFYYAGANTICFLPVQYPGRTVHADGHVDITIRSTLPPNLLKTILRHEMLHALGIGDSLDLKEDSIMAFVVQISRNGRYHEMENAIWYSYRDWLAIRTQFLLQDWAKDFLIPCCF